MSLSTPLVTMRIQIPGFDRVKELEVIVQVLEAKMQVSEAIMHGPEGKLKVLGSSKAGTWI